MHLLKIIGAGLVTVLALVSAYKITRSDWERW